MRHITRTFLSVGIAAFALTVGSQAEEARKSILGIGSYWRIHATYAPKGIPPELLKETKPDAKAPQAVGPFFKSLPPPENWRKPEFDDSMWVRATGPLRNGHYAHAMAFGDHGAALFSARAKFLVKDASKVKGLVLSATYAGGIVVYVNGVEVARRHLPQGELKPLTPAEPYPKAAYIGADGKLLSNRSKDRAALSKRKRKFSDVQVPAKLLKNGVNLLAVEIHQSSLRPEVLGWKKARNMASWPHLGLFELHLTSDGSGAVEANNARPDGFQVWNQDVNRVFSITAYGDPNEKLRPIRLCGPRNGYYSGQIVVSATSAIAGLKAEVSELTKTPGPGKIPAASITVRYGMQTKLGFAADKSALSRRKYRYGSIPAYGSLTSTAPGKVEPATYVTDAAGRARLGLAPKMKASALLPVWVTVKTPADAPAGKYRGTLKVSATGLEETSVAIEMEVLDWTLPDPRDFNTYVNIYQSPEAQSIQYKVPMWSKQHWKLMERSFEMMGQVGNRFLSVPLVNHTQFGNEHSMIPWIKQADGSFKFDFTNYDRYVKLAARYCKLKVISYQVYLSKGWTGPPPDKPTFVTVKDPKTGKLEAMQLPAYGTPEAKKLLTPLVNALKERHKQFGIQTDLTTVLGISQDCGVHKAVVAFFKGIYPEAMWHYGAHSRPRKTIYGLAEYLYVPWDIPAPEKKRKYGWKNKPLTLMCQRMQDVRRPPMSVRVIGERALALGDNGPGRMCMDYWPVEGSVKSPGGRSLFNRWPESTSGQRGPFILYLSVPGKEGAIPSIKFMGMREGLQECEARIFIEKALVEKKVSGELAARCQDLLDRRTHFCRIVHSNPLPLAAAVGEGWQKRSSDLYRLAVEVAGILKTKTAATP